MHQKCLSSDYIMNICGKIFIALFLIYPVCIISHVFAQSPDKLGKESSKVEVMVLGTFHFHHSPDYYDINTPRHQQELDQVLASLAEFAPGKIMLEATYKDSTKFDSLYQKYRAGDLDLSRNERQQLGFRLADRLDHEAVYTVDYILSWPYGEVMGWAEKNAPEFMQFYENWNKSIDSYEEELYREATLAEHLRWLNSDDYRDRLKSVRMRRLELGGASNFMGAKPISSSYERNLKIFANIMKYAEPGDRIMTIFGASHGYFLREFVQMHPDTELVESLDYL